MEFSTRGQRNTLIFAVVTLVVIGFSLIASTWQILRQQQESGLQYLAMSARSISQTVENTFRRHWRLEGHKTEYWARMGELFSDIESNSEIIFIEILDDRGRRIFEARKGPAGDSRSTGQPAAPPGRSPREPAAPALSPEQFKELKRAGEWYGLKPQGPEEIFIYGVRIRKIEASALHRRPAMLSDSGSYMLVGLSTAHNQGLYDSFRQNALLQSVYILAAALFIWGMAVSLISRRAIVGRAKVLERFQAKLLDNLPDGLITVGPDKEIQAANPAAHELLGFTEGSMAGKSLADLPPAFVDSLQLGAETPGTEESRSDGAGRISVDWRQADVDGKQLEILMSAFTGEHDQPVHLLLFRDRTRLHSLERSLAEAEKMAAVGTLAAGVAHEIRNPLSALRGFAQYFAKKFAGSKPDEEYANTMVREADRLNRVITDLLYLSRNRAAESVPVDLTEVVAEVTQLLRFDLEAKQVSLNIDLPAERVMSDHDSAKQALLNLMLNSLDALAEKREMPETPADWRPEINLRSRRDEGVTLLEVEDNGTGMSEEQRRQAFEAFFTSKCKGTGLGLSLVNKTVHEHGGRAWIASEPGKWCRVVLQFLSGPE